MTETECAYCVGRAFIDHGPDGMERGLCRRHAQQLAVNYSQVVAMLRRGAAPINMALDYVASEEESP